MYMFNKCYGSKLKGILFISQHMWSAVIEGDGCWGAGHPPGTVNLHICGFPYISLVGVTFSVP